MHEYVLNMSGGQSVKELLLLSVQLNDITAVKSNIYLSREINEITYYYHILFIYFSTI